MPAESPRTGSAGRALNCGPRGSQLSFESRSAVGDGGLGAPSVTKCIERLDGASGTERSGVVVDVPPLPVGGDRLDGLEPTFCGERIDRR